MSISTLPTSTGLWDLWSSKWESYLRYCQVKYMIVVTSYIYMISFMRLAETPRVRSRGSVGATRLELQRLFKCQSQQLPELRHSYSIVLLYWIISRWNMFHFLWELPKLGQQDCLPHQYHAPVPFPSLTHDSSTFDKEQNNPRIYDETLFSVDWNSKGLVIRPFPSLS